MSQPTIHTVLRMPYTVTLMPYTVLRMPYTVTLMPYTLLRMRSIEISQLLNQSSYTCYFIRIYILFF